MRASQIKHTRVQAEWPRAIEELCSFPHIEEAGVLSTCNRLELYVVALSWHRVRLHSTTPMCCALARVVYLLMLTDHLDGQKWGQLNIVPLEGIVLTL